MSTSSLLRSAASSARTLPKAVAPTQVARKLTTQESASDHFELSTRATGNTGFLSPDEINLRLQYNRWRAEGEVGKPPIPHEMYEALTKKLETRQVGTMSPEDIKKTNPRAFANPELLGS